MRYISELLNSPTRLYAKAQKARELTLRLEAQATKTTTRLTGMPGGGGADKDQLLARLADARTAWGRYHQLMVEAADFVRDLVLASPLTDQQKEMLVYRYIDGETWANVNHRLGSPMSDRNLYRLHNSTLDELDKYFVLGGYHEEDTYFVQESL